MSARIAAAISSSETVTMSSTYFSTISKFRVPGTLTWMPSANVTAESEAAHLSCRNASANAEAPSAWTP